MPPLRGAKTPEELRGSIRNVSDVCPNTGRELSTGVEMDAATFERLPEARSQSDASLRRAAFRVTQILVSCPK